MIKEPEFNDNNPFMDEEEFPIDSHSERVILVISQSTSNKRDMGNHDFYNRQPTQHGGELVKNDGLSSSLGSPADILNSKEQKICEKTNCRNCELNNCGAIE